MNDFQMNLAADVLARESVKGERKAIEKNKEVAGKVRKAMLDSGATTPELLALVSPIKEVRKRMKRQKRLAKP